MGSTGGCSLSHLKRSPFTPAEGSVFQCGCLILQLSGLLKSAWGFINRLYGKAERNNAAVKNLELNSIGWLLSLGLIILGLLFQAKIVC